MSPEDLFGVAFFEGAYVAYGLRSGNGGALSIGQVMKIENNKVSVLGASKSWKGWCLNYKSAPLRDLSKVIIIPEQLLPIELYGLFRERYNENN